MIHVVLATLRSSLCACNGMRAPRQEGFEADLLAARAEFKAEAAAAAAAKERDLAAAAAELAAALAAAKEDFDRALAAAAREKEEAAREAAEKAAAEVKSPNVFVDAKRCQMPTLLSI